MSQDLEHLVKNSRILVIVGSGGVGKTTCSVALALMGARLGLRVGLLSIDPAKRLADALGIKLSHELSKVELHHSISGQLEAAMLDQKASFDDLVRRFAPSPSIATKIFGNAIYREVSSNLGGPLEYMALAKLDRMLSQGKYDLIVLDTPPDSHALDFLAKPNLLAGFIEHGVMRWMIKPFHLAQRLGAGVLLKAGGKMMSGISAVTGIKMLKLLAEFLVLLEDVILGLNRVGREVTLALKQSSTGFVLVSAPTHNAVRSSQFIMQELKQNQFPLRTILLNRHMPSNLAAAVKNWRLSAAAWPGLTAGLSILECRDRDAALLVDALGQKARQEFGAHVPLLILEEQQTLIHTEASLWNLTDALLAAKPWINTHVAK